LQQNNIARKKLLNIRGFSAKNVEKYTLNVKERHEDIQYSTLFATNLHSKV